MELMKSKHPLYRSYMAFKEKELLEGFDSFQQFADACLAAGWRLGRMVARCDMDAPMRPDNLVILERTDLARVRGARGRKDKSPLLGCPMTLRQLARKYGVPMSTVVSALYHRRIRWEDLGEYVQNMRYVRKK